MGYKRAEEILPKEVIELIQQYVDGTSLYIPRREENRKAWGTDTRMKQELRSRNEQIYAEFQQGSGILELAERYFLSEKSIQRIIRDMKE